MPSHPGARLRLASVGLSLCAAAWLFTAMSAAVSAQETTGARAEAVANAAGAAPDIEAPANANASAPKDAGTPVSTPPAADAAASREIAALIAALGASGCEFQRNGTWYDAATARAHLQRKYAYLRKRDLAPTAELFIERAASRSSVSGKAYRVRCPGRAEQASADWFLQRLRALRALRD